MFIPCLFLLCRVLSLKLTPFGLIRSFWLFSRKTRPICRFLCYTVSIEIKELV